MNCMSPPRGAGLQGNGAAERDGVAPPAGAARTSVVRALGLENARLIALCGAGGKTGLMSALVREWSADDGERVLATTTTKLGMDELSGPWTPVRAGTVTELVSRSAAQAGALLAYSRRDEDCSRLLGFSPETVDALAACGRFTRVVVEADGSRRRPLKVPRETEPVFPAAADAVVAVAGLSGLGAPLGDDVVFGADRWARLTGVAPGAPVSAESLARIIVHCDGLMRGAPDRAWRAIFLNQADRPDRAALAETVLEHVARLGGGVPDRAVIGQLRPVPLIHGIRRFAASAPRYRGGEPYTP